MIKINKEDKLLLKKHISNLNEIIKKNDIEFLLDEIDDKIVECI